LFILWANTCVDLNVVIEILKFIAKFMIKFTILGHFQIWPNECII
jgi:hypothetical protein